MKKDKEWLKNEVLSIVTNYPGKVYTNRVINLIDQLEEPQQEKVVVNEVMAGHIENCKNLKLTLSDSLHLVVSGDKQEEVLFATLVGRLTKDIEVKYTDKGKAYANFTLAINRQFTNQSGERDADFINCVIWNKAAENLAKFTRKGALLGIEGRIRTRSYDNSQQQRVYVTEVVAGSFSLLESKPKKEDKPTTFSTLPDVNYDPHGPGETVEEHGDGYPF